MTTTEFEAIPAVAGAEPRVGTLVMKFGGTSVADPAKIKDVAQRLVAARAAGNRVVAVLSAMGDSTTISSAWPTKSRRARSRASSTC